MAGFFRRYALLGIVIVISVVCMVAAIHTFLAISGAQDETPVFDNRGMSEPDTAPEPPARKWEPDRSEGRTEEDGLT